MLTRLSIRGFKRFDDVVVDLGNPVVFIGPNNSGKSTALQALALWDIGVKRWVEKRGKKKAPEHRPGVTVNRRDLTAVPVANSKLLWRDLHVRDVRTVEGKQQTQNVLIDIVVEGVTVDGSWRCGMEFDYANSESFYCRPMRVSEGSNPERLAVPDAATAIDISYLQPMSGIAANEVRLDPGAINVYLGEGRTAEVLRNLCFQVRHRENGEIQWNSIREQLSHLFGVHVNDPVYVSERGEIQMSYSDRSGAELDLSSAGRGLQQTLLLLSYLSLNRNSVLLIDEPDAHLEILRQRQIYHVMAETARAQGSQIIAASHSEVVLNEAADRDVVVAFVGKPHRIDDRGHQVLKSLKEIGFEHYYQAEETGWVLYLEGATDLAILQAFAQKLGHPASIHLERPFVHYVQNEPRRARNHFFGLREAKENLVGFVLVDHIDGSLAQTGELAEYMWDRREIENYLCQPETLESYAESLAREWSPGPLFEQRVLDDYRRAMHDCIEQFAPKIALENRDDEWWIKVKASDEFLDRIFRRFFESLSLPNLMTKTNYHRLAHYVAIPSLDQEVPRVLDQIVQVAERANTGPS